MNEPSRDLESVQIPEPCSADWESMAGDERRRYCDQCRLHVHNVAAMPRDEAEALIARKDAGEQVCVRLEYEADGTCVTADAPRESSPRKATALALAFGTGLLAACRSDEPRTPEEPRSVESSAVDSEAAEDDAVESGEALEEPERHGRQLLGRISFDGQVTVNSDGQLTAPDDDGASAPQAGHPPVTSGASDVESAEGARAEGPPRPPAIMGTPGTSGPAAPHGEGSDAGPAKPRVLLGTPGPMAPQQN